MAKAYAKSLPRDKDGAAMSQYPAPALALARNAAENATASSVISVTDNTTALEITAMTTAAVLRWVPVTETAAVSPFASVISAVSGANYDHVIPVSTMRRFVIPQEVAGTASVVGANVQNGLYRRYAIKSIGVGSVLTAEY